MAEDRNCTANIKNDSGVALTLTGTNLSWGKWATNPPMQIAAGQFGNFEAEGRKGTATGTQGSVTYQIGGGNTDSFTIQFDVPYSSSNSGGIVPNSRAYSALETDATYHNGAMFPPHGNQVVVYFVISRVGALKQAPHDPAGAIAARLKAAAGQPAAHPTVDIATAARTTDCGLMGARDLIRLFNGKTEMDARQVLAIASVPPEDLVRFATKRGLLPDSLAFASALDFADHVKGALQGDAAKAAADVLSGLHGLRAGGAGKLDAALAALRAAAGKLQTQQRAAAEAVLACIDLDPQHALLRAASCARNARTDDAGYAAEAAWQRTHLQAKL